MKAEEQKEIFDELNRLQRILDVWAVCGVLVAGVAAVMEFMYHGLWFALSGLGGGLALTAGGISRAVFKLTKRLIKSWEEEE